VGDRTHEALEAFVTNNVHDEDEREAVAEQQAQPKPRLPHRHTTAAERRLAPHGLALPACARRHTCAASHLLAGACALQGALAPARRCVRASIELSRAVPHPTCRAQSEVGAGPGEGCMVRGVVLVNRVPGNFHISAHSKSHSFQPHKLNMSHHVNSMSFGKALSAPMLRMLPDDVERGYDGLSNTDHLAIGQNTSLEHYLKVVHTSYEVSPERTIDTFQYTVNNNHYQDGESLPSAVFFYDVSPMQVLVREERKSFAAFLTQLCAIIGGIFTVTGLLDAVVFHGGNTLRKKMEIGKAA
jgi:hypothetical protein